MSYTNGTFAALVDAIVPETPALEARGDCHVPGGLSVGLEAVVIERVNGFQETDGVLDALGYETSPLATVVAGLLDAAAVELLARRRAEDGLQRPQASFSRGPFSRLSREDRLRALRLLEDAGAVPALAARLDSEALGTVRYLISSLPILVEFVYYSELTAAEDEPRSLGWEQAGYPGPADGYPVVLGYELDAFEEDDY